MSTPPSRVDFEKWARRDEWFLEECVMLLLGLEPFDVYYLIWPKPNAKGFDDIYETARRSIEAGTLKKARPVRWASPRTLAKYRVPRWQHRWKLTPRGFLAWAREKGYPIPQGLEEAVNRFHPEIEDRTQADLAPQPQKETPAERRARITARVKELRAAGDSHATKTVANEEGITPGRLRQVVNPTPKAR